MCVVYRVNRCKVTVWKHSHLIFASGWKRNMWLMVRMEIHPGVLKSESVLSTHSFIYQTWRERLLFSVFFMISLIVVLTYHLKSMVRFALQLLFFVNRHSWTFLRTPKTSSLISDWIQWIYYLPQNIWLLLGILLLYVLTNNCSLVMQKLPSHERRADNSRKTIGRSIQTFSF